MSILILNASKIAVYIHIPFCEYKCHYCDFYLETGWSRRVLESTLERTMAELTQEYEKWGRPEITTLYFGGGTPSVLPADLLENFLTKFSEMVGGVTWTEGTFEMNPESCSLEKIQVLERFGINRISLGIQTFSERFLTEMGRRCSLSQIDKSLALLKEHWRGDVSLDLISGYPDQTVADLEADLEKVLVYAPAHLSLYDLTVEEGTPLATMVEIGQLTPLSETIKEDLWLKAREVLRSNGYQDYETSNFAKVGHESQHNRGYWNLEPYLGLGAGAVSLFLAEKDGEVYAVRRTNSSIFSYRRGEGTELEWISASEFLFEHFLVGWRTRAGVSGEIIRRRFGASVERRLSELLKEHFASEVEATPEAWRLIGDGRDLLNSFLIRFGEIYEQADWGNLKILGY